MGHVALHSITSITAPGHDLGVHHAIRQLDIDFAMGTNTQYRSDMHTHLRAL
jgi:hypothetical protein